MKRTFGINFRFFVVSGEQRAFRGDFRLRRQLLRSDNVLQADMIPIEQETEIDSYNFNR